MAGLLNEAGINTYTQLAGASKKKLAAIKEEAGSRFRSADTNLWQDEARSLAAQKKLK